MHPTTGEQLAGARRLLDQATHESGVPAVALELLVNAKRLLNQAERSWSASPAFHEADNANLLDLLSDLRDIHFVPSLDQLEAVLDVDGAGDGLFEQAERNARLRSILSDVIAHLPVTSESHAVRARIRAYLCNRVESDPT